MPVSAHTAFVAACIARIGYWLPDLGPYHIQIPQESEIRVKDVYEQLKLFYPGKQSDYGVVVTASYILYYLRVVVKVQTENLLQS